MRIHWWQSIRWRLALGSMLVALLATALLAFAVTLTIGYYYGSDQRSRLTSLAAVSAARIGSDYFQGNNLAQAATAALNPLANSSQGSDYLIVVFNRSYQPVYPQFVLTKLRFAAILASADPSLRRVDFNRVRDAVVKGAQRTSSVDDIGVTGPGAASRPFTVRPIFAGGQSGAPVVGILFMTPRSAAEDIPPPFLAAVRQAILIASIIVAALAALAAILFSRTITRPLAKLTNAARGLTAGNYSERVKTGVGGELGELAATFNEMAAQLERDVNELHQQELWRRELLMNITHDLATPLTAIAGLSESLVDGVNRSREDYEATGRIIERETLRLRRLVKDLHMMAKMEAGALQPKFQAIHLSVLVDEVLAVLAPEFERANVEPRNYIPYNLPVARADADMLMRVFSNLCDNALHYTPAGGTVKIDAVQRGNILEVSVTDSGEGIPPEALPRVFDRFYRVDASRQVARGGSGLGLAIVRGIIEAHGGTIRAENVPNGGARIIFTLPLSVNDQMPVWSVNTIPL